MTSPLRQQQLTRDFPKHTFSSQIIIECLNPFYSWVLILFLYLSYYVSHIFEYWVFDYYNISSPVTPPLIGTTNISKVSDIYSKHWYRYYRLVLFSLASSFVLYWFLASVICVSNMRAHFRLFPERYYILLLLAGELLVLYPSRWNLCGFQLIMFSVSCIMQCLRYHTVSVGKKWMERKHLLLERRKVIAYHRQYELEQQQKRSTVDRLEQGYGTNGIVIRRNTASYDSVFEMDGMEWNVLTLKADPTSSEIVEFLIFKLILLGIGIYLTINSDFLEYGQVCVCMLWVINICYHSIASAARLRREAFLATKGAQLALRVLLYIQFLALMVLFYPVYVEMNSKVENKMQKWNELNVDFGRKLLITPGQLFFLVVYCSAVAFIFLPVEYLSIEDIDNENVEVDVINRPINCLYPIQKQKIHHAKPVVTLAKETYSLKVFPQALLRESMKPSQTTLMSTIRASLFNVPNLNLDDYIEPDEMGDVTCGDNDEIDLDVIEDTYTPVFCLEIACWMLETSWQAQHSEAAFHEKDFSPGRLSLNSVGLKLEHVIQDSQTDSLAYIASNVNERIDGFVDNIIVVSFRGSTSVTSLKNDVRFHLVPLPDGLVTGTLDRACSGYGIVVNQDSVFLNETLVFDEGKNTSGGILSMGSHPQVHEGFLTTYMNMREELLRLLSEIYQRQLRKVSKRWKRALKEEEDFSTLLIPKIYICGYSLGGCVGQLLALDLALNFTVEVDQRSLERKNEKTHVPQDSPLISEDLCFVQPPIGLYNYGCPRVGNRAFAQLYETFVPHTFRICSEGDKAPDLPPFAFGFRGFYKHAGTEVSVDDSGNLLVGGPTFLHRLSGGKSANIAEAHTLQYYRDCLESSFLTDELLDYYQGSSSETVPEWVTQIRSNNR